MKIILAFLILFQVQELEAKLKEKEHDSETNLLHQKVRFVPSFFNEPFISINLLFLCLNTYPSLYFV